MPRPNGVGVGVAVFLVNEKDEILLGKRKGAHRAGHWSPPGGWIDRADKKITATAIREVREETGLAALQLNFLLCTTEDHPEIGVRTVTLYYVCKSWEGDVQVMEPEKCEEWKWFHVQSLPTPLFPGVKEAQRVLSLQLLQDALWRKKQL